MVIKGNGGGTRTCTNHCMHPASAPCNCCVWWLLLLLLPSKLCFCQYSCMLSVMKLGNALRQSATVTQRSRSPLTELTTSSISPLGTQCNMQLAPDGVGRESIDGIRAPCSCLKRHLIQQRPQLLCSWGRCFICCCCCWRLLLLLLLVLRG